MHMSIQVCNWQDAIYIDVYLYIYILTYIHIYIYIYIHIHIYTYIHIYINTYIHTYMHAYIHTYVHTYIHTYIHTVARRTARPGQLQMYSSDHPASDQSIEVRSLELKQWPSQQNSSRQTLRHVQHWWREAKPRTPHLSRRAEWSIVLIATLSHQKHESEIYVCQPFQDFSSTQLRCCLVLLSFAGSLGQTNNQRI